MFGFITTIIFFTLVLVIMLLIVFFYSKNRNNKNVVSDHIVPNVLSEEKIDKNNISKCGISSHIEGINEGLEDYLNSIKQVEKNMQSIQRQLGD